MLPIANPRFNEQALKNVIECVSTGWISSQGKFVKEFEERFAAWIGIKHAVSTNSGTTALHLALSALGIFNGDEVLVPSFTFIATANAAVYNNAVPTFCDVDPETWCIDVEDAKDRITTDTRAIIPVHINGYPCDMSKVMQLALDYNLVIVEDVCQALGGTYNGRKLGTLSHVGCFSFFANKHLTTGEGGMCVTDNDNVAETMRTLRDHGRAAGIHAQYVHELLGYNYRMTNLQAAVGISQLDGLDAEIERRRQLNEEYRRVLALAEFEESPELSSHRDTQPHSDAQSPWLFHCKLGSERRAERVIAKLAEVEIESKSFYMPVHLQQPYYDVKTRLPVSESLCGVMLPLHKGVTTNHIEIMGKVLVGNHVLVH